jgi:hypothetical protein
VHADSDRLHRSFGFAFQTFFASASATHGSTRTVAVSAVQPASGGSSVSASAAAPFAASSSSSATWSSAASSGVASARAGNAQTDTVAEFRRKKEAIEMELEAKRRAYADCPLDRDGM